MMMHFLLLIGLIPYSICANPYFWHITDLHLDPSYYGNYSTNSCNDVINDLDTYGDYECDAPYELIRSSVKAMTNLGSDPEFIIYSGDTPPHLKDYTAAGWSEDVIISFLQNATDLFNEFFPNTKFVMVLGNHDYFPRNQLPGSNNPIYEAAADMWTPWLKEDEAVNTFKKGAYYTQMVNPSSKLRVVVINSHLYAENNKATEGTSDPGDQYAWLQTVLKAAQSNSEKVHLIAHTPLGVKPVSGSPSWLRDADNTKLSDIIIEFSDVIMGVYSCHEHFDTFRLFYKEGKAVAALFIAPSVTPWRARITQTLLGNAHNPGIRKVLLDDNDGHLVDIEQYYLDLPKANQKKDAQWLRLYTFRDSYDGVSNLTAPSLHQLVENFKVYANNDFHKYYNHYPVAAKDKSNTPCNCTCKFRHICTMQAVKYSDFTSCSDQIACGASSMSYSYFLFVCALILQRMFP